MARTDPDSPRGVRFAHLANLDECVASWVEPRVAALDSSRDAPALRRWGVIRDGIVALHRDVDRSVPDVVAEVGGALDPVERDEVIAVLLRYEELVERSLDLDDEPAADPWISPGGEFSILAKPTFVLDPLGDSLALRLRVGRARTGDVEAELLARVRHDARLADVILFGDNPEIATLDVDFDGPGAQRAERELARWARLVRELPPPSARTASPGRACFSCTRLPYCGAFPNVGGDRRPATTARLLVLTKTALASACDRRIAWSRLFRLPADAGAGRDDDGSPAAGGVGAALHARLAAMVRGAALGASTSVDEEPDIESTDQRRVEALVARELAIRDGEHDAKVDLESAEEQAGVYINVVNGRGERVVVAMLARLDARGREPDGPCVVEYKTGSGNSDIERDLYSVILWHRFRAPLDPVVVVHHHWLGREDLPRCERVVFHAPEVEVAAQRLATIAARAADWDPANALDPAPLSRAGAECVSCEFARRCGRFGGPGSQDLG